MISAQLMLAQAKFITNDLDNAEKYAREATHPSPHTSPRLYLIFLCFALHRVLGFETCGLASLYLFWGLTCLRRLFTWSFSFSTCYRALENCLRIDQQNAQIFIIYAQIYLARNNVKMATQSLSQARALDFDVQGTPTFALLQVGYPLILVISLLLLLLLLLFRIGTLLKRTLRCCCSRFYCARMCCSHVLCRRALRISIIRTMKR